MGLSEWLAWCELMVSGRGCADDKVLPHQFGIFTVILEKLAGKVTNGNLTTKGYCHWS